MSAHLGPGPGQTLQSVHSLKQSGQKGVLGSTGFASYSAHQEITGNEVRKSKNQAVYKNSYFPNSYLQVCLQHGANPTGRLVRLLIGSHLMELFVYSLSIC